MELIYLTNFLKDILNINDEKIIYFLYTILCYVIYKLIIKLIISFTKKIGLDERSIYQTKQKARAILSIILFIILIYIWQEQIKDFITLISLVSAALTLAAREIIFNYFCGIYIRLKKPIKVEDRIEVDEIVGDVVNINSLNTEILEVNSENNQSTGIIVNIPNSTIFTHATKNYNAVFKYIWDEIEVRVDINSDAKKVKLLLLEIIKTEETLKEIPKKMKRELAKNTADYRIYYNNLTPIIYTKIYEDTIIFNIRFLIHPKKQRVIESNIYEKVLQRFKEEEIIIK